ncbi:unnamed protein product [Protopolystoma xenopodis]|uniref:Uncharacterized protein n=1 Tax=Protopolystoma xenopodis TaxID=117903 RepID=A0A448WKN9_9PLAT|nr:unnamed protein product [Protopolystoma xenopodis]
MLKFITLRSSILSTVIFLFASFQGICGFVLPVCDAFATNIPQWMSLDHKYYREAIYGTNEPLSDKASLICKLLGCMVFFMAQYIGAIIGLAYLQVLIFLLEFRQEMVKEEIHQHQAYYMYELKRINMEKQLQQQQQVVLPQESNLTSYAALDRISEKDESQLIEESEF